MKKNFVRSAVAAALTAMLLSGAANANVVSIDFNANDGGWTVQTLTGTPPTWTWNAGTGRWEIGATTSAASARLLSPVFVANGTSAGLVVDHVRGFEIGMSGECWDGGNLKISVNGGAFALATGAALGYHGNVSTLFSNPLAGQSAWCEASVGTPASGTSTWSGSVNPGDQFQFAFDAGWDSSVARSGRNWAITSIELRDFDVLGAQVPEPASIALLGLGFAGIALSRRRLRR